MKPIMAPEISNCDHDSSVSRNVCDQTGIKEFVCEDITLHLQTILPFMLEFAENVNLFVT